MITVIIPTFNHAQYLQKAIAAIALQGECIKKIIVVNDGSSDNTEEVINNIKKYEERIIFINLKDNIGLINAINMALSYIDTEYFAFAAADDFLLPDWAERSLNALIPNAEAALCLTNTYVCSEDKSAISKTKMPNEFRGPYLDKVRFRNSLIRYGIWFSSNTVLFRSSKYESSFYIKEAESFSDGLMLSLHGLKNGVCVVDQPLGCFFQRETSMSGSVPGTFAALRIIPAIGDYLYRKDHNELVDLRVANSIFKRSLYLNLNESLIFVFNNYAKNLSKYLPKFYENIGKFYFKILFWLIKITSFLLLKPGDVTRLGLLKRDKVSAKEFDFINNQDLLLSKYYPVPSAPIQESLQGVEMKS